MKTTLDLNKVVSRLLKSAPVEWPRIIARLKLSNDQENELIRQLDRHAEACAALSGYLEGGGKKAKSRQRKVSRALGYTYPDRRGFPALEA